MTIDETQEAFEEWYKGAILPAATVKDLNGALYTKESLEWTYQVATAAAEEKYLPVIRDLQKALDYSRREINFIMLQAPGYCWAKDELFLTRRVGEVNELVDHLLGIKNCFSEN